MPPQVKITKDEIIKTTVDLVRANGEAAINARAIATALNCSTQPIFSNFTSMEELEKATRSAAYEVYLKFINNELESGKYPQYKSLGMAYIRFAREEKELFKFLFMCDRTGLDTAPSYDFEEAVELIMKANGISKENATLMHLEMWSCVHGVAVMFATSFLPLEWELVSDMLSNVYLGVRSRHISEEKI